MVEQIHLLNGCLETNNSQTVFQTSQITFTCSPRPSKLLLYSLSGPSRGSTSPAGDQTRRLILDSNTHLGKHNWQACTTCSRAVAFAAATPTKSKKELHLQPPAIKALAVPVSPQPKKYKASSLARRQLLSFAAKQDWTPSASAHPRH
jgi:hypothetical protein